MKLLCCSCGGPAKGEAAKTTLVVTPEALESEVVVAETEGTVPETTNEPGEIEAEKGEEVGAEVDPEDAASRPTTEDRMATAAAAAAPLETEPAAASADSAKATDNTLSGIDRTEEVVSPSRVRDTGIGVAKVPASATAEPRLSGPSGYYLTYNRDIGGGILSAKYSRKALTGTLVVARTEKEIDDLKFADPAVDLAKSVKADWLQQAKATCTWIRSAAQLDAEIEILPSFFDDLPRKSMLVLHTTDLRLVTLRAPCAFDFAANEVDGVAVVPLGSDVYRGFSQLKVHAFLEKGVRKGATLRIK